MSEMNEDLEKLECVILFREHAVKFFKTEEINKTNKADILIDLNKFFILAERVLSNFGHEDLYNCCQELAVAYGAIYNDNYFNANQRLRFASESYDRIFFNDSKSHWITEFAVINKEQDGPDRSVNATVHNLEDEDEKTDMAFYDWSRPVPYEKQLTILEKLAPEAKVSIKRSGLCMETKNGLIYLITEEKWLLIVNEDGNVMERIEKDFRSLRFALIKLAKLHYGIRILNDFNKLERELKRDEKL